MNKEYFYILLDVRNNLRIYCEDIYSLSSITQLSINFINHRFMFYAPKGFINVVVDNEVFRCYRMS